MHAPSCTFTLFPILIKFTSPLTTVLNQMLQSSPISTSPTIVELGAKKQLLPNCGNLFSTGSITGMIRFLVLVYSFWLPASVFLMITCCVALLYYKNSIEHISVTPWQPLQI